MTPASPSEVLCPLTCFDNAINLVGMCVQYVLTPSTPLDVDKIENAIARVVDKWRLLAGRLVWLKDQKIWAIRVPIGSLPPNYATYIFTTTQSTKSSGFTPPVLTPSTIEAFGQPPRSAFVSPKAVFTSSDHQKHPLFSFHVTVFPDCTCIGVTFPHGVFDGVGFGHLLRAIDAELNGREWEVPPLETINPVDTLLKDVPIEEGTKFEGYKTVTKMSAWSMATMLASLAFQHVWHGVERGQVYFGRNVVKGIVDPVKKEVMEKSGGKEWVSTADIMSAWIAAYLNEPNSPNTLSMAYIFDARPVLAEASGTSFDSYPHNTVLYSEFTGIPLSSLPTTPLSTLALHFRHALTTSRTLKHVKQRHYDSPDFLAFRRPYGVDTWGFSNQTKGRYDQVDWGGGPIKDLLVNPMPINGDSIPLVNELDGGIIMSMDLRCLIFVAWRGGGKE
ncbi:hypothetical protein MNV49_002328 [Pseudohyphozyma bogoriensis]|nr:hypothetical protein MNV49_002328 [Pseudohyphozyma bogoriensis]